MNKYKTLTHLFLASILLVIVGCTDSIIDDKFSASTTERKASFTLSVNPKNIEFDYNGGTKTVEVKTEGQFEVKIDAEWLFCEKLDDAVKIKAEPNTEIDSRQASIAITVVGTSLSQEVKISQYGGYGITITDYGKDEEL